MERWTDMFKALMIALAFVAIHGAPGVTSFAEAESSAIQRPEAAERSGAAATAPTACAQGPAFDEPRELLAMLEQRRRVLAKKEDTLRQSEERLLALKKEVEQSLAQFEQSIKTAEENRKAVQEKQAKAEADARRSAQAHVIKMYEAMPSEDAAARIEKMPDSKAVELLRLLKGKTAGAILAAVKPAQAAKLTEQLINHRQKFEE
jgi:flagellar motility protein MotE (MotC chaperone)